MLSRQKYQFTSSVHFMDKSVSRGTDLRYFIALFRKIKVRKCELDCSFAATTIEVLNNSK